MTTIKQVYLAGQITGLSGREAKEWREQATALLSQYDLAALDPTRGKEALIDEEVIAPDAGEKLGKSGADIFYENLALINACDALLVKFCLGFGTPFEMGYAYVHQKPVIVWLPLELEAYLNHPFMTGVTAVALTLPAAVQATYQALIQFNQVSPFLTNFGGLSQQA